MTATYAGHRFSSHLAAQWAVFFDALNIAWRYAPPSLTLPSGTPYAADFHLPDLDLWVVVEDDEDEFVRNGQIHAEAAYHLRTGLLILGPIPQPTYRVPQHFVLVRHDYSQDRPALCLHVAWAEMLTDRDVVCEIGLPCTDQETEAIDPPPLHGRRPTTSTWTQPAPGDVWPPDGRIRDAYRAAQLSQGVAT